MSIKIMSKSWDVSGITHTQKIVLLSLSDQANDDGLCWPSSKTTADRVGLCERATRKAIAELESLGHLTRKFQTGRPTYYTIHPCIECTPAHNAPLHLDSLTPAPHAATPAPRLTDPCTSTQYNRKESSLIVIEPSGSSVAEATSHNKKNTVRGSRLSNDWALPREWGNWALENGLTKNEVILEAEKFRDHWIAKTGKDASKADWSATWRNWIRNRRPSDNKTYAERTQDFKDKQAQEFYQPLLDMTEDERKAWGFT